MSYSCPLCFQALNLEQRMFRCSNNHCFDIAKEGYINLMPVQHKRSREPGDNKEMMQARRLFLEQNHYQAMQKKVSSLCNKLLVDSHYRILDIGCGEGYYTSAIADSIQNPVHHVYGLDISKVAIRYAAKRYNNCSFSVASSHRLPFTDKSLDAIVRIYAPCSPNEMARVLDDQGLVVTVTPGSRHLIQLRQEIYREVKLHNETEEELPGFTLEREESLNYMMHLTGPDSCHLLQMTPFAWKATQELWDKLKNVEHYECEAHFIIRVYRKQ
ncbi:23S rRNA (guanine(745)-N(1))-methyltransferase [Vibrio caribbeanicus]|uniref:23S rRNA (guanine(745)-N(1))-methyltransferase n=1 Tax=Vibrio caribbeanicus TaxID=701175 RepID=UPI0030D8A3E4